MFYILFIIIAASFIIILHYHLSNISYLLLENNRELHKLENKVFLQHRTINNTHFTVEELKKISASLDKNTKHLYNIRYYLGVAYRDEIINFVERKNDGKSLQKESE
jgi:hypothetical protein